MIILNAIAALLAFAVTAPADEVDDVIDRFAARVKGDKEFKPEAKKAAADIIAKLRGDKRVRESAVTESLRALYPGFARGLEAIQRMDAAMAANALEPLLKSPNPFLAADAAYHLGRVKVVEQEYESAQPLFGRVAGEWAKDSVRTGEAMFYKGLCELRMLRRDDAIDTLTAFVESGAPASPRIGFLAQETLRLLMSTGEGSLDDIAEHMDFSRRRLYLTDAGANTQEVQERIIAMLDVLIDRAEQPPPSPSDAGSCPITGRSLGQGGSGMSGNSPGGNASPQTPPRIVRRMRPQARSPWDDLRKRDRGTEALSAIKAKLPARYQELIEQYYRDLQGSDEE